MAIVESIVAISLVALASFFAFRSFQTYVQEAVSIRSRSAIRDIENAVRQAVFKIANDFYVASTQEAVPCMLNGTSNIWNNLNIVLPSAIQMTTISQAQAQALRDNASKDPGTGRFNSALDRCAQSWLAGAPGAVNISASTGLYFCLQFSAVSGTSTELVGTVASMQPIFAEFYFTPLHVANAVHAGLGRDVMPMQCNWLKDCLTAAPSHAAIGQLYYTLYWSPRSGTSAIHQSVSGYVGRGIEKP